MSSLTNEERAYLEHMIPHHQVAVDMSRHLLTKTSNPTFLSLCREVIWQQQYEIWYMQMLLQGGNGMITSPLLSDNNTHKRDSLHPF